MNLFKPVVGMRLQYLMSFLLITATLTVYWQLGNHGFINYDDPEYVYENPYVRMGLTRIGLTWAFTTFHSANWHPITWLSHMADVQLFGLDPWGHHITSLILHTSNAVLLFLLLCRVTGFPWRSMVVAALFALHPLHVESVAWVAERKDLLSTLFWLLTLYFYAGYVKSSGTSRYLLVVVAFAVGLMTKPMLVTIPFVMLLLDFWPLGRTVTGLASSEIIDPEKSHNFGISLRQLFLEKVPLLVLTGISCAITLFAQHQVGAIKSLSSYPFPSRVANALTAYADYLYKMVWPQKLAVFYPFPKVIPLGHLLVASGLLTAISAMAFFSRAKKPYLLFGWLWYLGTLIPVIGLVQVGGQASADRYTYIPLIGIFIAIVWWLCDCTAGYKHRQILLPMIATVTLSSCAVMTLKQVSYWRNDVTLFSRALAVTDDNYVAHNNLGFTLSANGNYSEASGHFNEAIRIYPTFADAYLNQGDNLLRAGEIEKSVAYINRSIELRPNFAAAYNDLGVAMLRMGRLQEAYDNFNRATDFDPLLADGCYNKGIVMSMMGRSNEAIEYYGRALRLNSDNPGYHFKMGVELVRQKRFQDAINYFNEALRLNPADLQARQYLEQLSAYNAGNGSSDK